MHAFGSFVSSWLAKGMIVYVGAGRVPTLSCSFISWPFLIMVTLIVWSGRVCSSRNVERPSVPVILVPLNAVIMSPPMTTFCPKTVTCFVPP
jgi:hypothetical protein